MIVVEGPDGAGKTTLISLLQAEWDIPVAPRVVSKDAEAMVDLREWVDQNLDRGFQNTIFDRHRLISETIYGPTLRKEQQSGFDTLSWLGPRIRQFYHIQPVIIYCLPPLEEVKRNIAHDPDNVVVAEHIDAIYTQYVTRAALDHNFAAGPIKVWDYLNSPTIKGKPAWLNQLHNDIKERLY